MFRKTPAAFAAFSGSFREAGNSRVLSASLPAEPSPLRSGRDSPPPHGKKIHAHHRRPYLADPVSACGCAHPDHAAPPEPDRRDFSHHKWCDRAWIVEVAPSLGLHSPELFDLRRPAQSGVRRAITHSSRRLCASYGQSRLENTSEIKVLRQGESRAGSPQDPCQERPEAGG